MPAPWEPPDRDDLVQRYAAGETVVGLARSLGVSQTPVRAWFDRNGLRRRTIGEQAAIDRWQPPVDLVDRYLAGESVPALARALGVSRSPVAKHLRAAGVLRSILEANRLEQAGRSVEQRRANSAAAHRAATGRVRPFEESCRMALSRQRSLAHVSPGEVALRDLLLGRGLQPVQQLAIGPYNTDLAIDPVAVEVFGGGWHSHGRHRRRIAQRLHYLFDQGWATVIVWTTTQCPITAAAADYVAAWLEGADGRPPVAGEYRVIWGCGKDVTVRCDHLNQLARVPAHGPRHY